MFTFAEYKQFQPKTLIIIKKIKSNHLMLTLLTNYTPQDLYGAVNFLNTHTAGCNNSKQNVLIYLLINIIIS